MPMSDDKPRNNGPGPGEATAVAHIECRDGIPLDFEDPHLAALEDNPEHAKKLTVKTILALFVSVFKPVEALAHLLTTFLTVHDCGICRPYVRCIRLDSGYSRSCRHRTW
jgi:hypothetical protein